MRNRFDRILPRALSKYKTRCLSLHKETKRKRIWCICTGPCEDSSSTPSLELVSPREYLLRRLSPPTPVNGVTQKVPLHLRVGPGVRSLHTNLKLHGN